MLLDQVGFVAKVFGVAAVIAIAFKTIAPRLPIPATNAMSLFIVLLPSMIVGAILAWQLWKINHVHPPHTGHD